MKCHDVLYIFLLAVSYTGWILRQDWLLLMSKRNINLLGWIYSNTALKIIAGHHTRMYVTRKSSLVSHPFYCHMARDLGRCASLPAHFPLQLTLLYISSLCPHPSLSLWQEFLVIAFTVSLKLCQCGFYCTFPLRCLFVLKNLYQDFFSPPRGLAF